MDLPGRWVSEDGNEGEYVRVHAAVKPSIARRKA
jgi:hypothetical protein